MVTAPRQFDEAKLLAMNEPLTVRVERIKNNARTPIPLPEGDTDEEGRHRPGGTGWTKDEIRRIEEWLVNHWTGGGLYEVSVTDSTEPNAQVMKWQPYWEPAKYPERTPPTLVDAAKDPQPSPQFNVQPQPMQVRPFMSNPAFPHGFPAGFTPMQQQPAMTPYYVQPPMPAPPPVGTPNWQAWQHEAEKRTHEAELKSLRDREAVREREALEAKHKAELDRERTSNEQRFARQDQQMADLRNMISGLATSLKDGAAAPKGPDPAIEALKLEAQRQREAAERLERERDAERRDARHEAQLREMREATQRQIDAVTLLITQTNGKIEAAAANRNDPMVSMLTEQARQHAETLREISRNQTAAMDKFQTFMMSPRDMIDLAQKQGGMADAAAERTASSFGKIIDLQTKVTENALSLQPQGSGVVDVVREGLNGLKEFGERWVGAKTMEQKLAVTSQVQMAQAAASMAHAQALRENGMNGHAHAHAPPPPHVEPQLAGPQMFEVDATGQPPAQPKDIERMWGRTDKEWFGPIIEEVHQTRDAVRDGELDPEGTANGIIMATEQITKMNVAIPAMIDLLLPGKLLEFMQILLPDATVEFREEVCKILVAKAREAHGLDPEDLAIGDDDDETDDGTDDAGDDVVDDQPTPTPAKKPAQGMRVVKSGPRA